MREFIKAVQRERFPVTYEVPSPRGGNIERYVDNILDYDFLDDLCGLNICNNPVGLVRIDPAPYAYKLIKKTDVEPIAHLTCRDSTLGGLQRWLLGAQSLGIKNILAMTGDIGVGDYPAEERVDHINSLELITGIKNYLNQGKLMPELSAKPYRLRNRYINQLEKLEEPTDFIVGGVILPQRSQEPAYIKKKVDAGADFFQTQITYDADNFIDFLEELEYRTEEHPPVLVATTPFTSQEQMKDLTDSIPQVNIPDHIQRRLARANNLAQESVEFTVEFYQELKDKAQERGLKTRIGAHIIPLRYEGRAGDIVRRLSSL